jgi:hypothetical protein
MPTDIGDRRLVYDPAHTLNRMRPLVALLGLLLLTTSTAAWKNGGESTSIANPKFGTHDYIALQGLRRATPSKVAWIKVELNAYFIGTEAPDNGPKIPGVGGGYSDTGACHCILFAANGDITNDRAESRVREEFDKAKMALAAGDKRKAAFYAGAMAHYLGDLSQFMHMMGKQSHWGREDSKLHSAYETQVEQTVKFQTRSSDLLDPFMKKVSVEGAPGEVAQKVARFTENGKDGRTTGKMYQRWKALVKAKKQDPSMWDADFKEQTGLNVNFAVNGIAGLLNDLR